MVLGTYMIDEPAAAVAFAPLPDLSAQLVTGIPPCGSHVCAVTELVLNISVASSHRERPLSWFGRKAFWGTRILAAES